MIPEKSDPPFFFTPLPMPSVVMSLFLYHCISFVSPCRIEEGNRGGQGEEGAAEARLPSDCCQRC